MHHSVTYLYQLVRRGLARGVERRVAAQLIALRLRLNLSPGCDAPACARARAASSGFNKRLLATKLLVARTGAAVGGSSRLCRATASARNPRPCRFIIAAFVSAVAGKRRPAHTSHQWRARREEPTSLIITSSVEDIYRHDQAVTLAETYGNTRSLVRKTPPTTSHYSYALREPSAQSIVPLCRANTRV